MKIDAIRACLLRVPFKTPQTLAGRVEDFLDTVYVGLSSGGITGWSEVAPGNAPLVTGEWSQGTFMSLTQNIFPILIAQIFRVHDLAGEVHTLAVGQLAVGERFAEHVVPVDFHNEKVHESVGDQNVIARLDVAREPLEAHGDALFIADYVSGI